MNYYDNDYENKIFELESQIQELQNKQRISEQKSVSRRRGFWWFILVLLTLDFNNY